MWLLDDLRSATILASGDSLLSCGPAAARIWRGSLAPKHWRWLNSRPRLRQAATTHPRSRSLARNPNSWIVPSRSRGSQATCRLPGAPADQRPRQRAAVARSL